MLTNSLYGTQGQTVCHRALFCRVCPVCLWLYIGKGSGLLVLLKCGAFLQTCSLTNALSLTDSPLHTGAPSHILSLWWRCSFSLTLCLTDIRTSAASIVLKVDIEVSLRLYRHIIILGHCSKLKFVSFVCDQPAYSNSTMIMYHLVTNCCDVLYCYVHIRTPISFQPQPTKARGLLSSIMI